MPGHAYAGGNARLVENCFRVSGPEMLYVGDHLFTDVNMAKKGLMWRTCLILQELEGEMEGLGEGQAAAQSLTRLLRKKDLQAAYINHLRTRLLTCSPQGGHARAQPAEQERLLSGVAHRWQQRNVSAAWNTWSAMAAQRKAEEAAVRRGLGRWLHRPA